MFGATVAPRWRPKPGEVLGAFFLDFGGWHRGSWSFGGWHRGSWSCANESDLRADDVVYGNASPCGLISGLLMNYSC